ncbi:MAG: alanine racemase [Pseudanabaenaceae cyanobacterium]
MLKSDHRAWLEIDLGAIEQNVRSLLSVLSPQTQLLAVVKADAYGHGSVAVSRAAVRAGARWLGVATLPEGVELRKAGITVPILILGGITTPAEVRSLYEYQLQATIYSAEQAVMFSQVLPEHIKIPVHLKVDTGMSRLGVNYQQAREFYRFLTGLCQLDIVGVYSHFATADDPDPTVMNLQSDRFQQLLQSLDYVPPLVHICNTAGLLVNPQLHYQLVRAGLGIYGYYPAPHLRSCVTLKPAMTIKARITYIKKVKAGTGISYGYSFITDRDLTVATVAIGYADGLWRGLSSKICGYLRGQKVRQIGTITMDQCLIDVSDVPSAKVGDVVTWLGGDHDTTADDWAEILGTISWEILCGFKHRLPRLYNS